MADTISNQCWMAQQPPEIDDGTVLSNCNLMQEVPGTVLKGLAGKAITFDNCNLTNVAIDPDWRLGQCNTEEVADIYAVPKPEPEPEMTLDEYIAVAPEKIRDELRAKADYYDAAVTAGTIADFTPKPKGK